MDINYNIHSIDKIILMKIYLKSYNVLSLA
jgi:hypothetical protein